MLSTFTGDYAAGTIVDWLGTDPYDHFQEVCNPPNDCWKVLNGAFSWFQYRNFDLREAYFIAAPNRTYLSWFVVQCNNTIPTTGYPDLDYHYKNETDELRTRPSAWKNATIRNDHFIYPSTVAPTTGVFFILSYIQLGYHYQTAKDRENGITHYALVEDDSLSLANINPNGVVQGGVIAISNYNTRNRLAGVDTGLLVTSLGCSTSSTDYFGFTGASFVGTAIKVASAFSNVILMTCSHDVLRDPPRGIIMFVTHEFNTSQLRIFRLTSAVNCTSTINSNGYSNFASVPGAPDEWYDSGVAIGVADRYHVFIAVLYINDPSQKFGFTIVPDTGSIWGGQCDINMALFY